MRSIAAAFLLTGCLFIAGCTIIPGVESTDLSSVQEETATRAEVESALGEPDLSRVTAEGRIDVYLYDQGREAEIFVSGIRTIMIWPMVPFVYAKRVDEQESYLTILYDRQDRVVAYATQPNAETPEEAITSYIFFAGRRAEETQTRATLEACNLPFSEVIQLDARTQYNLGTVCPTVSNGDPKADPRRWQRTCLAAHGRYPDAQRRMGVLIYYNRGETPQGHVLVQAYKWFNLAKVNDGEGSLNTTQHLNIIIGSITVLSRKMTPDQRAEAWRLVAEWEPNPAECETIGAQAEN
jgi:hypothetical protein